MRQISNNLTQPRQLVNIPRSCKAPFFCPLSVVFGDFCLDVMPVLMLLNRLRNSSFFLLPLRLDTIGTPSGLFGTVLSPCRRAGRAVCNNPVQSFFPYMPRPCRVAWSSESDSEGGRLPDIWIGFSQQSKERGVPGRIDAERHAHLVRQHSLADSRARSSHAKHPEAV